MTITVTLDTVPAWLLAVSLLICALVGGYLFVGLTWLWAKEHRNFWRHR